MADLARRAELIESIREQLERLDSDGRRAYGQNYGFD